MKRIIICLFFAVVFTGAMAQDTGEIKTVDGKKFKIHKVQAGETVFALSRLYDVSAGDIMSVNPKANEGLNIGQEIMIPIKEEPKGAVTHKVEAGETLFAISKKYNVDIEDIQKLNGMNDVALSLGQVLVIKAESESTQQVVKEQVTTTTPGGDTYIIQAGETLFAISRKFNVSVDDIMKWNSMDDPSISPGQVLRVRAPGTITETITTPKVETTPVVEQKKENTEKIPDEIQDTTPRTTDDFVEVTEKGVAELIPDTENTRKYLALHRGVKPGTIIRVRNEMNGREVWARVIGKLPETGENKDILVKVSRAAFDRLGAVDKKFRVTITYIP